MSDDYSVTQEQTAKRPKVHFEQYLYNSGEPDDDGSRDFPAELEAELLEDSYVMKRRFRHVAQRMRSQ